MKNLYVVSGPVRTGKTTNLMHWLLSQKNADGIAQPVVDDKRFIYHIGSRTLKLLEMPEGVDDNLVLQIGIYRFNKDVFEWSQNVLMNCLNKNLDWIIIDEIGPLELSGKGLEPAFTKILSEKEDTCSKILCVVRDSILQEFIKHYNLENNFEMFEF